MSSSDWCLTEALLQRLRGFHAQCVRAMCRVTRTHTWRHRLSSEELRVRLGLDSIDYYVSRLAACNFTILACSPRCVVEVS